IGRTFARDEDIWGHDSVAVISYGLWQQLFGGDPGVSGASIHLNGRLLTVIGVAPANFDYPGRTSIWTPTVFDFERMPKRGAFLFQTIGRLKQGVTVRRAQEMFQAEVRRAHPSNFGHLNIDEHNRPQIVSLRNQLAGPVRQASWVLAAMTLLVLLTACANVAQLLLSRAIERKGELELRAALGASRARLLQQLVTEATLLTMTGAAIGLVIARWTSRIASSVAPAQLSTQGYTILDWRVLGFAVALALVTGLVFGVTPAWLIGRLQPSGHMVRNQTASGDLGTKRARAALVVLQAALTLALLTSSVAMGRTFLRLLNANLGFHPASVITLNVSLLGIRHSGSGEWQYYSEALHRLRSVPGVEAAGAVSYLPLANNVYMANAFNLDSGQRVKRIVMNAVMPGYFSAMGTSFLAGHDFAEDAMESSERSVIVNDAFAKITGLGSAIVGRRLTASGGNTPYLIAGVVATTRFSGPAYPGAPEIYWPIQEEPPAALTLVARVTGQPEAFLARCRDAVRGVDPQVPIYDVQTLSHRFDDVLSRPRFYTTTIFFLALLAALLVAVGIYGTAAHSIAQRKHEMGVRMALGASYQRIRGMMLRESLTPIIVGAALGIILSLASGRYLGNLLENAAEPTAWASTAGAALLLLTGLTAAWNATGRVLSIDPADALRAE
ncbi:MAG: FtsX-like permease family protein, partial [Bryobacteraceae bacterium]